MPSVSVRTAYIDVLALALDQLFDGLDVFDLELDCIPLTAPRKYHLDGSRRLNDVMGCRAKNEA